MKPDLVGAQGRRLVAYIEESIAVSGKHEIGARVVNTLIDGFTSRDRSHKDAKFAATSEIDRESNSGIVGAHGPRAELILLRMSSRERADIEYDFLLRRPRGILMAHDAWVLCPLGEAVLINIAVIGCRDACILLRLACLQFCGKLIYQRFDWLKSRVGIAILRVEIRDDARVLAVAQPVVIIDTHTAECFDRPRHDRRNWRVTRRCLDRIGGAQWQAACKRNCARSRETEGKAPSSGKLTHENNLPSVPSVHANIGPMRRLAGALWAQPRFELAHSGGNRRIWARLGLELAVKRARHQSQSFSLGFLHSLMVLMILDSDLALLLVEYLSRDRTISSYFASVVAGSFGTMCTIL